MKTVVRPFLTAKTVNSTTVREVTSVKYQRIRKDHHFLKIDMIFTQTYFYSTIYGIVKIMKERIIC